MILNGIKKEEYRDIRTYYTSRFKNAQLLNNDGAPTKNEVEIVFRNGYKKEAPILTTLCSLRIDKGKEEWGAESSKKYYVLEIRKIQNTKNIKTLRDLS